MVLLYGLTHSPTNKALLRRPQRIIAVRAIRGYRTVSWTAATLLAGDPPWELQAKLQAEVYQAYVAARTRGERMSERQRHRIKNVAHAALVRRWRGDLESSVAGRGTVAAVGPHLYRWINRKHGNLSFRLTQVLTGHGCFGKYLYQIARREEAPGCHECGAPIDNADHTLGECPTWSAQRHDLVATIGGDLSLPAVIRKMLSSDDWWSATASFCEAVIAQKEAAERAREANAHANQIRRRRLGRRRREYVRLMDPPS